MSTTIQLKRGLTANLTSISLVAGEPVFALDTGRLYVSDGTGLVPINRDFGTAANFDVGNLPGQLPFINPNGKLDAGILPSLAITDVFVTNSETEMLALAAETGDLAVRTDINESFILSKMPASELANWVKLLAPPNSIVSVNGKTGIVLLSGADIALAGYTIGTALSAVSATDSVNAAIGKIEYATTTKAALDSPTFTGVPNAPNPAAGTNNSQIATTAFVKTAISVIDGGTF